MLQAPFPYFGGKSRIADLVWRRFGDVPNFVEPFFGSGATLLCRPHAPKIETVNDLDCHVANFWRAVKADPEAVAVHADNPVNETDLSARHIWLVNTMEARRLRVQGDADYFDAKVAGWWCWGLCCWIGSGWCSGKGCWNRDGGGQLVHLGNAGRGVNRKRVHLGNAGRGVNRKRVHLGDAGRGGLVEWMLALADRLRHVRVCCGDWSRVCGETPTVKQGMTAVFLDPPYSGDADRADDLYATDSNDVAHDVRAWCEANGGNPLLRIALCGYEGEGHDVLVDRGWEALAWKTAGGYGSQGGQGGQGSINSSRERIWFSPACIPVDGGMPLFGSIQ